MKEPSWPMRYHYMAELGYVVWRDVFEGEMKCSLHDAVITHKEAVFVSENAASDYCRYRNEMTMKYGSDDVTLIRHGRHSI